MEITVKMSGTEYDEFRAYQKDRTAFEQALRGPTDRLRAEHEALCSAILDAVEEDGQGDQPPTYRVEHNTKMCEAVGLAADWFA